MEKVKYVEEREETKTQRPTLVEVWGQLVDADWLRQYLANGGDLRELNPRN